MTSRPELMCARCVVLVNCFGLLVAQSSGGDPAGCVRIPVGELAVQLRVEVPPEYLEDLQPDIETLAQSLRPA